TGRERLRSPGQPDFSGCSARDNFGHHPQSDGAQHPAAIGVHRQPAHDRYREVSMRRRKNQRGLTLVELIVAFTIMMVLTTLAVPLARSKVRAERERSLRRAVVEMRNAIDKYKDYADKGFLGPQKLGTNNWPESLD